MSKNHLKNAQQSHSDIIKEILNKIDVPVIDHIALEMASRRRYLNDSMPEHFSTNFLNVGIILGVIFTFFVWAVSSSVWIAAAIIGASYFLLHRRMLWLMDRYYFLSKTPKAKRLVGEAARGLYAPNVNESGYDEKFLKPILLRYLSEERVTGLEFWNMIVEIGYAFRSEFHDTKMNISEVDDWFMNGRIDTILGERSDNTEGEERKPMGLISTQEAGLEQKTNLPALIAENNKTPNIVGGVTKPDQKENTPPDATNDDPVDDGVSQFPVELIESESRENKADKITDRDDNLSKETGKSKGTSSYNGEDSAKEKVVDHKSLNEDTVMPGGSENPADDVGNFDEHEIIDPEDEPFGEDDSFDYEPEDEDLAFSAFTGSFDDSDVEDEITDDTDKYDAICREVVAEEDKQG